MKTKDIIRNSILIIILFLSFSVKGQYTKWEKDVSYYNIKFKKIRFIVEDTDTTYAEGSLLEQTIIEGYPCHNNIVFIENWKLVGFILAENHFMHGAELPKGTRVRFYKDFTSCFFAKDTKIQGYCCNGNYSKWYSMGITTSFYLSGKLRNFYPCNDIEINNIFCKSSPFAGVKLFENGSLKECKLANDQKINGKLYKKNKTLIFDETGALLPPD